MYTLANANPDGAYSITFCSNEQLIPVIAFLLINPAECCRTDVFVMA
jgi:hypothetical protein